VVSFVYAGHPKIAILKKKRKKKKKLAKKKKKKTKDDCTRGGKKKTHQERPKRKKTSICIKELKVYESLMIRREILDVGKKNWA